MIGYFMWAWTISWIWVLFGPVCFDSVCIGFDFSACRMFFSWSSRLGPPS